MTDYDGTNSAVTILIFILLEYMTFEAPLTQVILVQAPQV